MSFSRGNLLLVGAGGFVGPWLARAALAEGWSVTGLSRRATPNYGPEYRHVVADALEPAACAPWVEQADAVIYNAAYIPTNFSDSAEAQACLRHNACGPLGLLGLLGARPRPFVYISTAQGYKPGSGPANETTPVFPAGHASYYLTSKLAGDIFTEHYRLNHGMPAVVLRAGSIYGPGQSQGMVTRFVQQARGGHKIGLKDAGRHQADLTFVGDLATAAMAAVAKGATGIFNVGSGQLTSALEAAQVVVKAAGYSDALLEIEPANGLPAGKGFSALDVTRARKELGFRPTSPAEGLARTVREWL